MHMHPAQLRRSQRRGNFLPSRFPPSAMRVLGERIRGETRRRTREMHSWVIHIAVEVSVTNFMCAIKEFEFQMRGCFGKMLFVSLYILRKFVCRNIFEILFTIVFTQIVFVFCEELLPVKNKILTSISAIHIYLFKKYILAITKRWNEGLKACFYCRTYYLERLVGVLSSAIFICINH